MLLRCGHSIYIRTVSSKRGFPPFRHLTFRQETFRHRHFITGIFGHMHVSALRKYRHMDFVSMDVSTQGLFGMGTFWHKEFSAPEYFAYGYFGTLHNNMGVSAQTFVPKCPCANMCVHSISAYTSKADVECTKAKAKVLLS